MIRRPPRSTLSSSSAASDVYKRQGFKALARRLCVGHAYAAPISWGEPVEVFGTIVNPGDLIHADKHGFLIIPEEDQPHILEASLFMDNNECDTVIKSALVYDRIDAVSYTHLRAHETR